jgi:hypothetical protein
MTIDFTDAPNQFTTTNSPDLRPAADSRTLSGARSQPENMTRRPKGKKGQVPPAMKPCPAKDRIFVMQFQFFDNGPKPGSGNTQHTMMLEAYLEEEVNLRKPHWKRVVSLSEAADFCAWTDKALSAGQISATQHAEYASGLEVVAYQLEQEEVAWAKIGRIEDRRVRSTIYPGQFVIAWRTKAGPMECHVFTGDGMISCTCFIHDQHSRAGTGRRKAFGFYDPGNIHLHKIAEQKAIAERRTLIEVKRELGLC